MNLTRKVEEAIRRDRLLEPGTRVGVACSGGADSVALTLVLHELKDALGLRLSVVHFNHQLRGPEADADEAFVGSLAERLGMECLVGRGEVAARARERRLNLEEAARLARFEFFSTLCKRLQVDAIALAHTLDDQAETVLARLLRGAGTRGLAGIYPVVELVPGKAEAKAGLPSVALAKEGRLVYGEATAGKLVRPLLGIRRSSLRDYLAERDEPWREDPSNLDTSRLRNRLRRELLPQLTELAGPAAVEHLARVADHARDEESFWGAYIEERFRTLVTRRNDAYEIRIPDLDRPAPELTRLPARADHEAQRAVARRLVRRILRAVRGDLRRLTQTHVEAILSLAEAESGGGELQLPGVKVERQFDRLLFGPFLRLEAPPAGYEVDMAGPGLIRLPGRVALRVKLLGLAELEQSYNKLKNLVDAGRVRFPLRVRNWQPGDAYQPLGASRPKKLKALFQQERVPWLRRAGYPVVLSGEEIVWVPGFGPAASCTPTRASHSALLLEEVTSSE